MSSFGRKGYKAFDHGMVCRGKQYAENTVFEETGAAGCCKAGVMHYCENPLDILDYYPLIDDDMRLVEVAEVEPMARVLRKENKCATKKIKIGAKLSFKDFVKVSIDFAFKKCKGDDNFRPFAKLISSDNFAQFASSGDYVKLTSSGSCVQLISSGNYVKLTSSGDSAKIVSSGHRMKFASSGDSAKIVSSGHFAALASSGEFANFVSSGKFATLASSGNFAKLVSSGDLATIASSGDYAKLASSGEFSTLASSGDCAQLSSSGKNSVVAAIGPNSKAKGALGNWVVLAEWDWISDEYKPVCVKAEQVDGERVKADTWYELKNGEFVECE